ncbi:hypothetical protein JCM19238_4683 [Vibrio ponticus]|nr:hypothetical protein JCM19238_4683 [Vibrio ponticus]
MYKKRASGVHFAKQFAKWVSECCAKTIHNKHDAALDTV